MAGDHHGIDLSWRHYALSPAEEDPGLEFDITRQQSVCGTGHIARCSELHLAWSFILREARPCCPIRLWSMRAPAMTFLGSICSLWIFEQAWLLPSFRVAISKLCGKDSNDGQNLRIHLPD